MSGRLKKLTERQASESVHLYESGLSLQDLATFYGVTRQSMWDLLRRRTKLRPQVRYGKENHFFRGGKRAVDRAQNVVENAVKKGIVIPQPCEVCGEYAKFKDGRRSVQAHHDDYSKPLDVRWLCQKHHHKWHKKNKAKDGA